MLLLLALQVAAAQPLAPPSFDYPPLAYRDRAEGEVAFELTISPEGRVSGCRIARSSGASVLDEATCRQTLRLRFSPARDAEGKPIVGRYAGTHRYALDTTQVATVTVAYAVSTEGRIEDCEIAQSSGNPQLGETACKTLTERGRFSPKRDAAGNPVRVDRREQRITFATTE